MYLYIGISVVRGVISACFVIRDIMWVVVTIIVVLRGMSLPRHHNCDEELQLGALRKPEAALRNRMPLIQQNRHQIYNFIIQIDEWCLVDF